MLWERIKRFFAILFTPFKKWWFWLILLIIAVLMYLLPTFNGVKPNEVHTFYKNKAVGMFSSIKEKTIDKVSSPSSQQTALEGPRGIDNVVDLPMRSSKIVKRKGFTKADSIQAVDALAEEEFVKLEPLPEITPEVIEEQREVVEEKINDNIITKLKKSSSLRYFKAPKTVSGIAIIHNANEIEINKTHMFLYGIYADPETGKGERARDFLNKITQTAEVNCQVVALTYQDVPTAICFVEDLNINETLVKEGFSRDVILGVK